MKWGSAYWHEGYRRENIELEIYLSTYRYMYILPIQVSGYVIWIFNNLNINKYSSWNLSILLKKLCNFYVFYFHQSLSNLTITSAGENFSRSCIFINFPNDQKPYSMLPLGFLCFTYIKNSLGIEGSE